MLICADCGCSYEDKCILVINVVAVVRICVNGCHYLLQL